MKKVYAIVFAVALMVMGASCNKKDDNNINKASVNMYNFIVYSDEPLTLSRGVTQFEINYDKKLISVNGKAILNDGISANISSSLMPMTAADDGYHFGRSGVSGINLVGCYDPRMGAMALEYPVGNGRAVVHSYANLIYAFTQTVITDGKHTNHNDLVTIILDPDLNGKTRLVLNGYDDKVENLVYENIPYTMVDGHGFTAKIDRVEDTQKYVDCVITNLVINVEEKGKEVSVKFDMGDWHVTIDGSMFYKKK